MGLFSFLDCVNPEYNFKFTGYDDGYLLIPKEVIPVIHEFLDVAAPMYEFDEGDNTLWGIYDGYGRFGGIDVYEFLAFCNLYNASAAEKERIIRIIYKDKPIPGEDDIILGYSPDSERARDIGIELFFSVGNKKLKYPLKITHCNDVCYEDVTGYSEDDPYQGY